MQQGTATVISYKYIQQKDYHLEHILYQLSLIFTLNKVLFLQQANSIIQYSLAYR